MAARESSQVQQSPIMDERRRLDRRRNAGDGLAQSDRPGRCQVTLRQA